MEEEDLLNHLIKGERVSPQLKEEREKIMKISEISLMLDSYDDIFSDFDPRPYSQRALSDDFLIEAKRASKEKVSGEIEMKFLIPKHERDLQKEALIKRRLHEHFKKHFLQANQEIDSIKNKGLSMIAMGIVIMIGAAYFSFLESTKFLNHLLIIILEPAGWFTFWTGLDQIFYEAKYKKPEHDFYEKMEKVEVTFLPY